MCLRLRIPTYQHIDLVDRLPPELKLYVFYCTDFHRIMSGSLRMSSKTQKRGLQTQIVCKESSSNKIRLLPFEITVLIKSILHIYIYHIQIKICLKCTFSP